MFHLLLKDLRRNLRKHLFDCEVNVSFGSGIKISQRLFPVVQEILDCSRETKPSGDKAVSQRDRSLAPPKFEAHTNQNVRYSNPSTSFLKK